MIKLSLNQSIKYLFTVFVIIFYQHNLLAADRDDEIREMMWNNADADFSQTQIPDKWQNKSAVILALSNHMEYKKEVILNKLYYNAYVHERIKFLDNKSLEEYAQVSIPEDGSLGNIQYTYYAGYKVIKSDGREIIIDLNTAVKEEGELNEQGYQQKKLAIPNLEIGDILDYYIVEEQTILLGSPYYSFDPIIFQLNEDYPIVKRRISFDVLRRCFINVKSLNGAPEFSVTEDAKNDKNSYYLEAFDLESVKNINWLFENRALPTIKFKITYASGGASRLPTFIGEPGVIKSNVSNHELSDFLKYIFSMYNPEADLLNSYMKKHSRSVKNPDVLAREAFYAYRNMAIIDAAESSTIMGKNPMMYISSIKAVSTLAAYYTRKKIPFQIVVGIPRQISAIEDLILENELVYMLKINTKNPFYLGEFYNHGIVGAIDEDLQGTMAYTVKLNAGRPMLRDFTLPETTFEENSTITRLSCHLEDLNQEDVVFDIDKELRGTSKDYYQYVLMDIYDYLPEEREKFEMEESFDKHKSRDQKLLVKQKEDYLSKREQEKLDIVKSVMQNDFDFEIKEAKNLQIIQTGRYHDKPEFKASYQLVGNGLIKKAGPNYIFDIGKLIEEQVEISNEQRERDYDIYMSNPRSFDYQLEIILPAGFEVQGLEKLNFAVENETGSFKSTASVEGNKLLVNTYKYYNSNFEPKENWSLMCEFLDAAYQFSQQNVLLRKKAI